jgi:glycosyltransferase involved in cell wall biosynthesis
MDMDKKNILIFSTSYIPDLGGAEVAVKEITDRMPEYNWHLVCFPDTRDLPIEEKIGNVVIHRISGPKFLYPFIAFYEGLKLHKNHKFDAVVSVMATYAGFAGLFFKVFFPKVKFVLNLQEGDSLSIMKRKAWFVYPLFMMIFRFADKIYALSSFLASYGRDMGHKGQIPVIPNGVDIDNFIKDVSDDEKIKLKKSLGKTEGDVYLITTSRLVYKNGVDNVIKSLQYLPENIFFLILGIGIEEKKLRKLAQNLGVRDRVKFIGFVHHKDIPVFFSVSDIFIRASRSEGFGNSFIEAMASGLPVIATPVGGIVDFISDGDTGIFVSPDNPKDISIKISSLISNKPLMEKIADNGKRLVTSKYSWNMVVSKIKEEVFRSLFS